MIVNWGAQAIAYNIGSQLINNYIGAADVGYGSGTILNTETTLINGSVRVTLTGSPDFTVARKVGFTFDFNSVQLSGLTLTEFGFIPSGTGLIGSIWQIERTGSVVFDGTVELQLNNTIEVINQ